MQAFFCFFMFFFVFLKSNSITFRFSLTWRHTNYRTIKSFPLYLQKSKRNEKQTHETSEVATQRYSAK